MSTYFTELQSAKLTALRELVAALAAADSPAEKRRCATAILKLPDPKPDARTTPDQSSVSSFPAPLPTSHIEHPASNITPPPHPPSRQHLAQRIHQLDAELQSAIRANAPQDQINVRLLAYDDACDALRLLNLAEDNARALAHQPVPSPQPTG